jgi:hypothetical protein
MASTNDLLPASSESPSAHENEKSGLSWLEGLDEFACLSDGSSYYPESSSEDGDDESLSSEPNNLLVALRPISLEERIETCWQLHPEQSHSDYNIVVQSEGGHEAIYYVHKVFLAVGPYKAIISVAVLLRMKTMHRQLSYRKSQLSLSPTFWTLPIHKAVYSTSLTPLKP